MNEIKNVLIILSESIVFKIITQKKVSQVSNKRHKITFNCERNFKE